MLLLLSGPMTHAQTTAQLTGTVQDTSGAVIPGAQVTLTDESTGVTRVVQTNRQGLYAFPSLVPGSYTVKVSAKSFQPKEVTGIVLHAGDERTVPGAYPGGGLRDATVTVEAAGADDYHRERTAHQRPGLQADREPGACWPRHDGAAEGAAGRDDDVFRPDTK